MTLNRRQVYSLIAKRDEAISIARRCIKQLERHSQKRFLETRSDIPLMYFMRKL